MLILSFFIIKPFLTALLTSMVLAYIFFPFYKLINKKIKNKNFASFIVTSIVILVIIVPTLLVLNTVSREAFNLYSISRQKIIAGELIGEECTDDSVELGCKITNYFKNLFSNPTTRQHFDNTVMKITEFFVERIPSFLFSIPLLVLNFFIIIFVTFFLFRDGSLFMNKVRDLLPLKKAQKKHVIDKFNDAAYAVIYGSIIIAIIQGTLGGIGFLAVRIPNPLIWAIIMILFSLVPYVGSTVIWLPAALILIFSGYIDSDTFLIIKGILLILYGTFVIGLADNFLKPKIIGDRARVHPVLVLLGVVGGLQFFGFIGIIVGPVILALLVTFVKIYEEEKYF